MLSTNAGTKDAFSANITAESAHLHILEKERDTKVVKMIRSILDN